MQTLTSALDRARRLHGGRLAVIDRERTFTWTEFCDRVARAAAVLEGLGVKRGDRYALLCRNTFRSNELLYAGYWLGAVPVPINYRLAPPEIRYILDNASCKALAVEATFLDFLKAELLAPWRDNALLVAETKQGSPLRQYEALMADAKRRGAARVSGSPTATSSPIRSRPRSSPASSRTTSVCTRRRCSTLLTCSAWA
jgi:acyl-CoA synthetase (AMP-forming)/AMP-acid ligase II